MSKPTYRSASIVSTGDTEIDALLLAVQSVAIAPREAWPRIMHYLSVKMDVEADVAVSIPPYQYPDFKPESQTNNGE